MTVKKIKTKGGKKINKKKYTKRNLANKKFSSNKKFSNNKKFSSNNKKTGGQKINNGRNARNNIRLKNSRNSIRIRKNRQKSIKKNKQKLFYKKGGFTESQLDPLNCVCSGNTNTMEGKIIYDSCVNQCNLDASLPDPIDFNTGDAQTDTDLGMCRNGGDTGGDTGI